MSSKSYKKSCLFCCFLFARLALQVKIYLEIQIAGKLFHNAKSFPFTDFANRCIKKKEMQVEKGNVDKPKKKERKKEKNKGNKTQEFTKQGIRLKKKNKIQTCDSNEAVDDLNDDGDGCETDGLL